MNFKTTVLPVALGIMLLGLFANTLPAAEIITETDIVEKIVQKEDFIRTADNFIILFDSSSSMKEIVNKNTRETKYNAVRNILEQRQKVLPDLGYNAGLYLRPEFVKWDRYWKSCRVKPPCSSLVTALSTNCRILNCRRITPGNLPNSIMFVSI